jgi:hypothetical protein
VVFPQKQSIWYTLPHSRVTLDDLASGKLLLETIDEVLFELLLKRCGLTWHLASLPGKKRGPKTSTLLLKSLFEAR